MKYQYDSAASSFQCTVNVPRKAENLSNDGIIENSWRVVEIKSLVYFTGYY